MKFHGEKLNKFRVMQHSLVRILNSKIETFQRFQDFCFLFFFFSFVKE